MLAPQRRATSRRACTCRTATRDTVTVIDPATFQVIDTFPVGALPQHVVPSYDMQTLYVNNNEGNSLTPIDPRTGKPGPDDPGRRPVQPLLHARRQVRARDGRAQAASIDVRDPTTWELVTSIAIPHPGVNHADFTADGTTMIASCEFSGWVVRIDLATLTGAPARSRSAASRSTCASRPTARSSTSPTT